MAVILVTGAGGQLGTSLKKTAKRASQHQWIFADREQLDITNHDQLKQYFAQHQPTHCINCAAYTNVRKAEQEPDQARAINATAVGLLVERCNARDTTLLHLSTDYVFDGEKDSPYTESDPVNPLNVYGKTKAEGEQIVLSTCIKGYVIRTAWLYAKAHGKNFYRTIVAKAKAGKSLQLVTDQIGSPTSTEDLSSFLLKIVTQPPPFGLYHFSGKQPLSWYEFAHRILQENNLDVSITPIFTPSDEVKRPRYSALASIKNISS